MRTLLHSCRHQAGAASASRVFPVITIGGVIFAFLLLAVICGLISHRLFTPLALAAGTLVVGGYIFGPILYFLGRRDSSRVRTELERAARFAESRLREIEPKLAAVTTRLARLDEETRKMILELLREQLAQSRDDISRPLEERFARLKVIDDGASREVRLRNGALFRDIAQWMREVEPFLARLREEKDLPAEAGEEVVREVSTKTEHTARELRKALNHMRELLANDVQETRKLLAEARQLLASGL